MATVNGNKYTTFGQGYAAEKAKGGAKSTEADSDPGSERAEGQPMMVTHKGGGKFKTQVKGEKPMNHESMEDMHEHMRGHFGMDNEDEEGSAEEYGSEPTEGVGASVKSILG